VISQLILSIGVDIVEVYRIRESLERTPRFGERVFTDAERAYCDSRGKGAFQSYAGRYAAKEALMKAIRTGWRGEIAWRDMEISNDDFGAPSIKVTGETERILQSLGADRIHLSISHTEDHAIAQVVLEKT